MSRRLTLSVVLPAFNEAPHIEQVLRRVFERGRPDQVIVVDDGSTDGTAERVEASSYARRLELVRHARNRGKSAAIRTALPLVRFETVIVQDGDLEYDPADYDRLLEVMERTGSPVVYGARQLGDLRLVAAPAVALADRSVTGLANLLFGLRIGDEATCYKLLRTELLRQIPLEGDRFDFCAEVTGFLGRVGVPIPEVPIGYVPRTDAEGRKLRLRDELRAAKTLWRRRTAPIADLLGEPSGAGPVASPTSAELAGLLQLGEAHNASRNLLARLAPYLGSHVLEIGAGAGRFTVPLVQAGKHVTACEASRRCARMVESRIGHVARFELVGGDFVDPAVQDALGNRRFDTLLSVHGLCDCSEPDRFLDLCRHRVAVGGRLLLCEPLGPGPRRRAHPTGDARPSAEEERHRALRRLLEAHGWTIEVTRTASFAGLLGPERGRRDLTQRPPAAASVVLKDRFLVPVLSYLERRLELPTADTLIIVARS